MNGPRERPALPVLIRPGTDGALACAVMHCLFRDGMADRDYLARYTDAPAALEAHLASGGASWAAPHTGPISDWAMVSRRPGTAPSTCMRRARLRRCAGRGATRAAAPFTTTAP